MKSSTAAKRGEMSFELIVVIGFVLLLFIPILFFTYHQSEASAKAAGLTFIDNYADSLAKGAEMVYYSGEGSYINLYIEVPEGIKDIGVDSLGEGSVLVINTSHGQITKYTKATLSIKDKDKLIRKGMRSIEIRFSNGVVEIG